MSEATPSLAIIGGTGADRLGFESLESHRVDTRHGSPSAPVSCCRIAGALAWYLPRHGPEQAIPPHAVNYRANIRALADLGVQRIVAINAVGSINVAFQPRSLVVPHQIIDYTSGREHTFYDGQDGPTRYVDFTDPYTPALREQILQAGRSADLGLHDGAVYGAAQGPRLETAAEIARMARDGCDLVGMTSMPEAALAREADIEYASIAVVVNLAAGLSADIHAELAEHLEAGMAGVVRLLENLVPATARECHSG